MKLHSLCFLDHNLDSSKNQKKVKFCLNFDSRTFIVICLRNYRFNFLHQVLNRTVYVFCGKFDRKTFYRVLWVRVLEGRWFENDFLVLIHPQLQTPFLRSYQLTFSHQVLNGQTFRCAGVFEWEALLFSLQYGFSSSKMAKKWNQLWLFSFNS